MPPSPGRRRCLHGWQSWGGRRERCRAGAVAAAGNEKKRGGARSRAMGAASFVFLQGRRGRAGCELLWITHTGRGPEEGWSRQVKCGLVCAVRVCVERVCPQTERNNNGRERVRARPRPPPHSLSPSTGTPLCRAPTCPRARARPTRTHTHKHGDRSAPTRSPGPLGSPGCGAAGAGGTVRKKKRSSAREKRWASALGKKTVARACRGHAG